MDDHYQYRVTVNGSTSKILDHVSPDKWSEIMEHSEARGYDATYERRLITNTDILPLLTDRTGHLVLGQTVACPWEIMAEARYASV